MKIKLNTPLIEIKDDVEIDLTNGKNISITLDFSGEQPSSFGAPKSTERAYQVGGFVGSVALGGSCNCFIYEIIPHCQGTHTECVGHLTANKIAVNQLINGDFFWSLLITVTPVPARLTKDSYTPDFEGEDQVITRSSLLEALESLPQNIDMSQIKGLIIRTLPNEEDKKTRDYAQKPPCFLTNEATALIIAYGINHLMVDFPSIDRANDDGRLSNHRIYFRSDFENLKNGELITQTITELIYVSNTIKDGLYLTQILASDFISDAIMSKIILHSI